VPGKLAAQLEVLEGESRYAACFTGAEIIDKNGQPANGTWADGIFTTVDRTSPSWLRHFFEVGNCLPLPSAMVRRSDLIRLALQLPFLQVSESMGNHDSKIVDAASVD
jgi:hypothetical protein